MLSHLIKTLGEIATKCLKMKSDSGTNFVRNGYIIIHCGVSQLHMLTAHTMGEFVVAKWNAVDHTCRSAQRQQMYHANSPVQGSGEVNGQSFPKVCQFISAHALSTTD